MEPGDLATAPAGSAEMRTMRAVVYTEYGPPGVLHAADVAVPVPGRGEALVRVKACAVNGYDLMAREGAYRPNPGFPHILGGDIAGTVEAYGPECAGTLPAGTHVIVYWVRACGHCEPCSRGFPTTCLNYRYLGAHLPGGYAGYVVVPEGNLISIGSFDDWIKAAAFPMAFGTSWHMLVTRGRLAPGETVLIQAAGSGIGVAAVQIARLVGASVIASAGSEEKLARARALGAEQVINYERTDLRAEIMRLTDKRGVDVVFEHVGGALWGAAVESATRNGRIITCGGTAGYNVEMNIAHVFHKQLNIIGSNSATRWELDVITPFLLDGRFDPVVDRVFPLEEAADAHAYVGRRQQFGKVVLAVDV